MRVLLIALLVTVQPVFGLRDAEEVHALLSHEQLASEKGEQKEALTEMKEEGDTPWEFHDQLPPKTLASELETTLRLEIKARRAAKTTQEKYPEYQAATEEELRFLEATAEPNKCQKQLRILSEHFTAACEKTDFSFWKTQVEPGWFMGLEPTTCQQNVQDLFLVGQDIVRAMQIPEELLWEPRTEAGKAFRKNHPKSLRLAQSLKFLREWFVPLATAKKDAILWAGFWTDPNAEDGHKSRTSKERLLQFAEWIEHDTVHPSTKLGRIMENRQELSACYQSGDIGQKIANNVWSLASFAFVLGMKRKEQGTVVALVNKRLDGDRPLKNAILSRFEVPTLGVAAWGLGGWSPQVLLIDLMATCDQTSSALLQRLWSGVSPWYNGAEQQQQHWSPAEYAGRSARITWNCLDCDEARGCNLDAKLAQEVQQLVEAKRKADMKCKEVLKAAKEDRFQDIQIDESIVNCQVLHEAAKHGRKDVVVKLLQHGADPNRKDLSGRTALLEVMSAWVWEVKDNTCSRNRDAVVKSAETEAKEKGFKEVALCLLEHGADPNVKNYEGKTALHLAAKIGDEGIVEELLLHGAKVRMKTNYGKRPLKYAEDCDQSDEFRALLLPL